MQGSNLWLMKVDFDGFKMITASPLFLRKGIKLELHNIVWDLSWHKLKRPECLAYKSGTYYSLLFQQPVDDLHRVYRLQYEL